MSEPLLTKRLHISGLTPAITPGDLERRLSSFGKVKAMDGFGALDALGDPRKFGFVTMDIGAKELAKCLNVLSGSTWKGAKLRIGEAKPDFQARLAQVHAEPAAPARPKRTRARNYGCPSSTLPLTPLSTSTAASTPGWIVTPTGRVVRPMRMRPERPLDSMHRELATSKGINGKAKKRVKPPPVRARRRLIDPTKWDSTYLKGVFLDAVPIPTSQCTEQVGVAEHHIVHEDEDESEGNSDISSVTPRTTEAIQARTVLDLSTSHQSQRIGASKTELPNVCEETSAALAMLGEMFGDEEDWDGKESIEEMEGLEDSKPRAEGVQVDDDGAIEVVPRDFGKGNERSVSGKFVEEEVHDGDVEMKTFRSPEPALSTNLKALFAPREDASFSLLGHLDLELDLELEDVLGISAPAPASEENGSSQSLLPTTNVVHVPATVPTKKGLSRVTFDPSLPLLFPLPDSLPHPYAHSSILTTATHPSAPACYLFPSAVRVRGLHNLPHSATFTRLPVDTPESIRERWEREKPSLTREWKKAWRETRGSRRRGAGAGGEIGGGY